jgi:hypothetical protein
LSDQDLQEDLHTIDVTPLTPDSAYDLHDFAFMLMDAGSPYEVAFMPRGAAPQTRAVDSSEALADLVLSRRDDATLRGIYLIPNPLDPTRPKYPHNGSSSRRASEVHVARRRVLFLDIDPNQTSRERDAKGNKIEMCSSAEELLGAWALARLVLARMATLGFAQPIIFTSGNGVQLLYRWDSLNEGKIVETKSGGVAFAGREPLPAKARNKALVAALARSLGAAVVPKGELDVPIDIEGRSGLGVIDPADVDAGRLCRMPQTWNRKGDQRPGRPHRMAEIVRIPDGWWDKAADDALVDSAIERLLLVYPEPQRAAPLLGPDGLKTLVKPKKGKATPKAAPEAAATAATGEGDDTSPLGKIAERLLAHPERDRLMRELVMALPTPAPGQPNGEKDWKTMGGHLYAAYEGGAVGADIWADWSSRDGEPRQRSLDAWEAHAARFARGTQIEELVNLLRKATTAMNKLIVEWARERGVEFVYSEHVGAASGLSANGQKGTEVATGYRIVHGAKHAFALDDAIEVTGRGRHVEVRVTYDRKEQGVFRLDGACYVVERKQHDASEPRELPTVSFIVTKQLGERFVPDSHYLTEGEVQGTYGVRVRFMDHRRGSEAFASISAGSAEAESAKAGRSLAAQGVQIRPEVGSLTVTWLMRWRYLAAGRVGDGRSFGVPRVLTSTMGWQRGRKAYVNGADAIFGVEAQRYDMNEVLVQRSSNVSARGKERGTMGDWMTLCDHVYTTPALRASIGLALTGASLEVLGQTTWGVHIYGPSSRGKSTALAVAGSVWGYCDMEQAGEEGSSSGNIFNSWKGTEAALERRASAMNSAIMILDDIGAINAKIDVPSLIIMMGNGRGKERQHKDWPMMSWRCTLMSSGEQSIAAVTNGELQSGAIARFLDLEFTPDSGCWITDRKHADRCKASARSTYGVAGNAWATLLATSDVARDQLVERYSCAQEWVENTAQDMSGTMTRIASSIATLKATIEVAAKHGILPWGRQAIDDVMRWFLSLVEAREVTSQDELAWQRLTQRILTSGVATEEQWCERSQLRDKYAIVTLNSEYYTTPALLKEAIEALHLKTNYKAFAAWMTERGFLGKEVARRRFGGDLQRWLPLYVDAEIGDRYAPDEMIL